MSAEDDINDSILLEFLEEAIDSLNEVSNLLIELEQDCTSVELVNSIFRPIHSIKGNAAFFEMFKVKQLAHIMEDLLDSIRKREFECQDTTVDLLISGNDTLQQIFTNTQQGKTELHKLSHYDNVLEQLIQHHQQGISLAGPDIRLLQRALELVDNSGKDEASELIREYLSQIHAEDTPENKQTVAVDPLDEALLLCREEHQGMPSDTCIQNIIQQLTLLCETAATPEDGVETPSQILENFTRECDSGIVSSLTLETLEEKLLRLKPSVAKIKPEEEDTPEEVKKAKKNKESSKSIRVAESAVDDFLNHVGELIVVREMFDHVIRNAEHLNISPTLYKDLRRNTDDFSIALGEIERSCMALRYQSISVLTQKVPRIVRDLAKATGKKILVESSGENINVDKSIIAALEDPLVHMVRNACDHGIEKLEDRLEKGKPESGTVHVRASEDEEFIYLCIGDDGAGLNLNALKKKGIEMGLFSPDATPSEQELTTVIFESGVSTAEKITDISGRGVGMDVVKRYIETAGGSISIENRPGNGADFIICMPKSVSTQIMQGMNVRVGSGIYVIPVRKVIESFAPESAHIYFLYDQFPCVKRFDHVIPIISLKRLFEKGDDCLPPPESELRKGIYVCVESEDTKLALHVDEIMGIQQVVLKELCDVGKKCQIFAGGTLMGDGSVSLVIDVEKVQQESQLKNLAESINEE